MNAQSQADAGSDSSISDVIRLWRLAQTGTREQMTALAEEYLHARAPGMLYVRAVALHCLGHHEHGAQTADRILSLTDGGGITGEMAGWRSIALAFRAWENMRLSDSKRQAVDLDSILRDLTQSEALLLATGSDGFIRATAHTTLGNCYHELRLYELARPNFEAAFAAATALTGTDAVDRSVTSQINLAATHLNWAMDLHRIGASSDALEKCEIASRHAAKALEYATTDEAQAWAAHANLVFACAESSRGDGRIAATRVREGLKAMEGRGNRESRAFALPFLARALERAGEHREALEAAQQACRALPDDATGTIAAAAYHIRATMLAESGSEAARAALAYGDQLAETLWRQRLRTLHNVRSMQFMERVTQERDQVQVLAHTDALTGVGNRRAFDVRIAALATSGADSADVAVIVVDVDGLKAINDAGGHEAGDLTLKAVAGELARHVRSDDLVARLGGDEFVAVLEGVNRVAAGEVAQRMVDSVASALGSSVTVSVGVATGPASKAGSTVLRAADRTMYAAKQNKKDVQTGSQPGVSDQSRIG